MPTLYGSNCDHKCCVDDELLSNCDHKSCVEDELLSNFDTKERVDDETYPNCDTKEKFDDETSSNCDTCLVEDESVRLGGKNSISVVLSTMTIHLTQCVLKMIFVT